MNNTLLRKENKKLHSDLKQLRIKYDILADSVEKINPRHDAERISDDHGASMEHLGDMSPEVLEQMIKTFDENFDEGAIKMLHGKDKARFNFMNSQVKAIKIYLKELQK